MALEEPAVLDLLELGCEDPAPPFLKASSSAGSMSALTRSAGSLPPLSPGGRLSLSSQAHTDPLSSSLCAASPLGAGEPPRAPRAPECQDVPGVRGADRPECALPLRRPACAPAGSPGCPRPRSLWAAEPVPSTPSSPATASEAEAASTFPWPTRATIPSVTEAPAVDRGPSPAGDGADPLGASPARWCDPGSRSCSTAAEDGGCSSFASALSPSISHLWDEVESCAEPAADPAPASPGSEREFDLSLPVRAIGEMMDSNILHKAMPFDGQRASWKTFSFQYRAYLIEELSTQLYFSLVLVTHEDSAGEMVARNRSTGEGAACWRQLQKEYNPSEAGNVLAMWTKLTDTRFEATDDVMVSISKLDEDMARHQKMSGEPMSDLTKRRILAKALKDHAELQTHALRDSSRLNAYEPLRAEVVSALTAERAGHDGPMDIGGLKGGKKAWNGRGNGKEAEGKEGQPNPGADLECIHCHKKGHRSANCRKRIADNKDTKQHIKDKFREKKRVAAAAAKELERIDWKYTLPGYRESICISRKKCSGVTHGTAKSGHWITNGAIETPEGAEFVRLRRHQAIYYCEYDRIIDVKTQPEAAQVAAVRKTLPRKVPAGQEAGSLPRVLGPEANETTTVPTRVLKSPCQPCAAERAAREGHRLPFRPWRPVCAEARADDDPRCALEPAGEKQVPKVVFDIFYVGTDQLAANYKLKGVYFSMREKPPATKADLEQAMAVLSAIDCKTLAPATLRANKGLDDYKVSFLITVLEVWGRTTAALQTDQEPAAIALANAVRDRRLGREIKMTDPIAPGLVNSVGWMIARFQPRSHGSSSHQMLHGKEYSGEIAEMGEQVWHMSQPELLLDAARPIGRSMYITERMIDARGPTGDDRACSAGCGSHSGACRQRFETIQADLLREKLDPVAPEAAAVVPAPAAGAPAPGECACRRCLMSRTGTVRSHFGEPEEEHIEQMVEVSAELHEHDQWIEDLYQKGRDDELQAMNDYGGYVEVATSTATDGKHAGGFPIAHVKEGRVRWRFVATEINKHEVREDNHQCTPPLMIVRATLSRAASSPTPTGEHKRIIQVWDVRKAFFNADVDEAIYVHPGRELCPPGRCWWLRKAVSGTSPNIPALDEDSTAICHGDHFLVEGYDEQLGELLEQQFEVTASARLGPGRPGRTNCLKRIIGYTDKLPGSEELGFFWTAGPMNVDFMIQWAQKRGCKPAPTPGAKATGQGRRDSLDVLFKDRAREVAGAAGTALYLSDRPDTMYARKTAMQHVSNPNVLMHARVQRLGRYYEGQFVLVRCYPLQGTREGIRVGGDADWALASELQRRSTSGGAVRYGEHTWDCYSVAQSTIALSAGEPGMYATGSATARGLQRNIYMIETQRPCKLKIYTDSTAGRGMCSRAGLGKVRHLELRYLCIQERLRLKAFELLEEDANEMAAGVLTKYGEWSTIEKHCTTLNLMFGKQFKGLSAVAVFAGVAASAPGEKLTVYEGPGQAAVCPAPIPHHVDREEFWSILKTGVFVVIAAVFALGCACGCYARNYFKKDLIQEAVDPAPGDADVYLSTRADTEARHKLFYAFLAVDLKQILRAKGLRVSGLKDDPVTRLIMKGNVLSDRQAKEVDQLRATARMCGPLGRINPQDLSSPGAAQEWIETFKSECRDRPDGSKLIHSES
ncbi:unnamed protein product [Prorocentrum cordatum]|uniref:Retrovirus-related Pol polyprotein from transposon TNT 1-94 n=1 Tax=Prorocentrum cordatum TaxID=2364126 RepID=A0ABN9YAY8_9DINO|nr:unnamed protein product [Polarella glacialis]